MREQKNVSGEGRKNINRATKFVHPTGQFREGSSSCSLRRLNVRRFPHAVHRHAQQHVVGQCQRGIHAAGPWEPGSRGAESGVALWRTGNRDGSRNCASSLACLRHALPTVGFLVASFFLWLLAQHRTAVRTTLPDLLSYAHLPSQLSCVRLSAYSWSF